MADIVSTSDEETDWEALYDALCDLEQDPVHLNSATRSDMERLFFLSDLQREELQEYLDRHRPMMSANELRLITSLTPATLQLLECMTVIDLPQQKDTLPSLKDIVAHGRHEVYTAVHIPFYHRKGDRSGYLGYPYRHWLRYDFSYRERIRFGIVGAQDAGEPFFAGKNAAGYDYYAPYFQLRQQRMVEQLVAGRYKLKTGMGLVTGSSFSLGKTAFTLTPGNSTLSLRPHASRSEADYFQGAAATLRLSKSWRLTLFGSYRHMDGTLNDNGTVRTLITNGYHRTTTEMDKKNNVSLTDGGGYLTMRRGRWHVGLSAVYTHLNRALQPNTGTIYRRYYAAGSNFINGSIDYGYASARLSVQGETAVCDGGALATLNAASLRLGSNWTLLGVQRFYSYRYTALHASAFSDGGHVQNESGMYLGAVWQPYRRLRIQCYADYAYFPWARYRISTASHAWDGLLHATYQTGDWTLDARYRVRMKQQDNANKTALKDVDTHRIRLSAACQQATWSCNTQADWSHTEGKSGVMLSEQLAVTGHRLQGQLVAAWFHTSGYETRLYLYERGLMNAFSNESFYGRGFRLALTGRWMLGRNLTLIAKVGLTHYNDRDIIGSGLQQIDSPTKTDLDLQARWRF